MPLRAGKAGPPDMKQQQATAEKQRPGYWTFYTGLSILSSFFGVLFFLLRKPLKQALADRRDSIQKELQDLEAKKEEAKREFQALEKQDFQY